ncbi:MAG TPA: hypothetical protein VFP46_00355 [Candidatus Paceibacterota bacterium]|nr:hypothetical protein [Candidatus Paceibacterota bacterium]
MQAQKALEQIGYTRGEAKTYLAALILGESHVSDIAAKIQEPLSTTQTIVDKLHRDGLLSFYVRKRYKYWVAEKPERLLERLKERERTLSGVLPDLEKLRHSEEKKPHVKVFEGVDEIRLIYEDMLETKQRISAVIPWDNWIKLMGVRFMEDFIEKRLQRSLRVRTLLPASSVAENLRANDSDQLRETRFLPESLPIKTTFFLYGNKVVIVSLNKQLPTAVMIDDADLVDSMALFFEDLWARCLDDVAVTPNLL